MANVTCDTYRIIDRGYDNERQHQKLTYDFSQDGGSTSDTYRMAIVNGKILITEAILQVETAFTSGGSGTVTAGAETADADAFGAAIAVATLVDDYAIDTAAGQSLTVGAADYLSLTVGTAALTAGKLHIYLSYFNAA